MRATRVLSRAYVTEYSWDYHATYLLVHLFGVVCYTYQDVIAHRSSSRLVFSSRFGWGTVKGMSSSTELWSWIWCINIIIWCTGGRCGVGCGVCVFICWMLLSNQIFLTWITQSGISGGDNGVKQWATRGNIQQEVVFTRQNGICPLGSCCSV